MNPADAPTNFGIFELCLAFVAAFFGVLVLRAMNRRLHIFSRGTVSFMLFALIVFTTVDTVSILNGIRNNQASAKSLAAHETVSSMLCSWLQQGSKVATHQVFGESEQKTLLQDLKSIDESVAVVLQNENSEGDSIKDLNLVALDVDRWGRYLHFSGPTRRFHFSALLDDGHDYFTLSGQVLLGDENRGTIRIMEVDGKLKPAVKGRPWQIAANYHKANAYRSPAYHYDSRRREILRQVALTKDD